MQVIPHTKETEDGFYVPRLAIPDNLSRYDSDKLFRSKRDAEEYARRWADESTNAGYITRSFFGKYVDLNVQPKWIMG